MRHSSTPKAACRSMWDQLIALGHASRNRLAVPTAHTARANAIWGATARRVSNSTRLIAAMLLRQAAATVLLCTAKYHPMCDRRNRVWANHTISACMRSIDAVRARRRFLDSESHFHCNLGYDGIAT